VAGRFCSSTLQQLAATMHVLQVLQVAHPPARKNGCHTVRVHRGFWSTWAAAGVRQPVLELVRELVSVHPDSSTLQVRASNLKSVRLRSR
jgi:hypothetical protein